MKRLCKMGIVRSLSILEHNARLNRVREVGHRVLEKPSAIYSMICKITSFGRAVNCIFGDFLRDFFKMIVALRDSLTITWLWERYAEGWATRSWSYSTKTAGSGVAILLFLRLFVLLCPSWEQWKAWATSRMDHLCKQHAPLCTTITMPIVAAFCALWNIGLQDRASDPQNPSWASFQKSSTLKGTVERGFQKESLVRINFQL